MLLAVPRGRAQPGAPQAAYQGWVGARALLQAARRGCGDSSLGGFQSHLDVGLGTSWGGTAGLSNSVKGLKGCEAVLLLNGIQLTWKKWIGKIVCKHIFNVNIVS